MQNYCFIHPRLQPLSSFSKIAPLHSFGQRAIMPVNPLNIYLNSCCSRDLSHNPSTKAVNIYLGHLFDLAAFISMNNHSEPEIPTRRETPMSIITRKKKSSGCIFNCSWLVVQLFQAKLFRNFPWSSKLASY